MGVKYYEDYFGLCYPTASNDDTTGLKDFIGARNKISVEMFFQCDEFVDFQLDNMSGNSYNAIKLGE